MDRKTITLLFVLVVLCFASAWAYNYEYSYDPVEDSFDEDDANSEWFFDDAARAAREAAERFARESAEKARIAKENIVRAAREAADRARALKENMERAAREQARLAKEKLESAVNNVKDFATSIFDEKLTYNTKHPKSVRCVYV